MDYLKIVISATVSLIALFISTKLIGNKQMSQLNMFDYINGITIGSIAAEMATNNEKPLFDLTAIIVYTILIVIFDYLSRKSVKIGRFLAGRSLILMENNKIYADNFKRSKLSVSEFITQCHNNGYFKFSDIESAIMEQNGKISIMPKAEARPVTPSDLNLAPNVDKPDIIVILDGLVLNENLKRTGNTQEWLSAQIKNQGAKHPDEIFIASCDSQNKLTILRKNEKSPKNDITQ